ncbi:MAG: M23 family metallopeptidase [Deltaproteobacteria bacterium]|nr:M23 family metallopeptidase [Deltaproteobacteria bacterium]MBT4265335.1 M23 family metallopeptidase [Deltaproteobacteria bacterium]MBT4643995.1 M23 family metallopeptidase [Deltaproteobacteria bacterium]MBT6614994.1 M23 family metallopeptidase [Deltaproteobacteria bacterium]MBT7888821.1 M23 family metallopeptidase [Deltaproteobacteria bacterium]
MLRNYLTVMIVPQKSGRIVKFEISALFIKMIMLTFCILIVASAGILVDYFLIKEKSRNMKNLENSVILQKMSIQKNSNMLHSRQNELSDLKKFDRKLRLISGVQESISRIRFVGERNELNEYKIRLTPEGRMLLLKLKKLDFETKLQQINFFQLWGFLQEQKDKLARTPSIVPAQGHISSRFGKRKHPFTGEIHHHQALDISNREYTPVYAPADGIVNNVRIEGNLGLFLVIDHGYNIVTRYGHLAKTEVTAGRKIKRGDLIARIGNTGRSTAPHLHYEILINDIYVDPEKYIFWDK